MSRAAAAFKVALQFHREGLMRVRAAIAHAAEKPLTPSVVLVDSENRIVRHLSEEPATVV